MILNADQLHLLRDEIDAAITSGETVAQFRTRIERILNGFAIRL